MKKVVILGSGYVGVSTAAIVANAGYKVHLIDPNEQRIKSIQAGKSFFFEAGIDPLLAGAIETGHLTASTDYSDDITSADIIFSCVGTPDNPDGSSNLTYVFAAAQSASPLMKKGAVYVQKSTVPVGTGEEVSKILSKDNPYVSNPEFLREGTAVYDTLSFDRVVIGGSNKSAITEVEKLYRDIEKNRKRIGEYADIATPNHEGVYIQTNLQSAELIKVTANAFLALKISFANSIAKLADESGADIEEVMQAVGSDKRIGRDFLQAGRGYGGGCFPKDVSGLIASATAHGVEMPILVASQETNDSMAGYVATRVKEALSNQLSGKKVAVLGLAFKAGTSDARKSPGIKIANILAESGAEVSAYDPHATEEAMEDLRDSVSLHDSVVNAINSSDAIVISTAWQDFKDLDLNQIATLMRGNFVYDCDNVFADSKPFKESGLVYRGVGRR